MSVELAAVQTRAVAILEAASAFTDLYIAEFTDGTINQNIGQVLASKGLATVDGARSVKPGLVCIATLRGLVLGGDARNRLLMEPQLAIAVLEFPLINWAASGAQKKILNVCYAVFQALHDEPLVAGTPRQAATTRFAAVDQKLGSALQVIPQADREDMFGIRGGNAFYCNFRVTGMALEK